MATSSITKDFYAKDEAAYNKLKKEIEEESTVRIKIVKSPSLEEGRKKLATFIFR